MKRSVKAAIVAATMGMAGNALAFDTVCSTATGSVQYSTDGYKRGIPPQAGDLINTQQIIVDGEVVSESRFYHNLNPGLGPISAEFSDIQTLNSESSSFGYVRYYSAKLTLDKNPQAIGDEPGIILPADFYVICQESFTAIP